jgi:hypothetical protein
MGQEAKHKSARRKARALFNGEDPMAVHAQALGKKCACGLDATTTIRTSAPASEILHKRMQMATTLAAMNGGSVPVFNVRGSDGREEKHIRLGFLAVCQVCRPAAEKEAAKGPSWVHVQIDAGPSVEPVIVGVK